LIYASVVLFIVGILDLIPQYQQTWAAGEASTNTSSEFGAQHCVNLPSLYFQVSTLYPKSLEVRSSAKQCRH